MFKAINADSINNNQIPSCSCDLLINDPPFGLGESAFDDSHYNRKKQNVVDGYVEFPPDYNGYYHATRQWMEQALRVLKSDGNMYIVSGWSKSDIIHRVIREQGWFLINKIVWKYNFGVYTKKKYVSSHYEIFYVCKNKKAYDDKVFNLECRYSVSDTDNNGGKLNYQDRESVWIINRENLTGKIHKNKNKLPSALISKMIQYSSNVSDTVGDFFAGSFIARDVALALGRHFIGQELNTSSWWYNNIKELSPEERRRSRIDELEQSIINNEGDAEKRLYYKKQLQNEL